MHHRNRVAGLTALSQNKLTGASDSLNSHPTTAALLTGCRTTRLFVQGYLEAAYQATQSQTGRMGT